jgi:hypothetical protein
MIDFTESYAVTDRNQFYQTIDGQPLPVGNGKYPPHEYDASQAIQLVPYVVQRHGVSMTVQVTFKNTISFDIHGTWSCVSPQFTRTSCSPSQTYNLTINQPDNTISIPGSGTTTVQLSLGGFPDCVCCGAVSVPFSIDAGQTGTGMGGTGTYTGTLYLTDTTPAGWMATPWAEVLGLACKWADGKSGKPDCLQYCTKGLYHSSMFVYHNDTLNQINSEVIANATQPDYGKFELEAHVRPRGGRCIWVGRL